MDVTVGVISMVESVNGQDLLALTYLMQSEPNTKVGKDSILLQSMGSSCPIGH